ncbi:MAG: LuxR C-terminal-related transcriptional regulator [Deltaproteobacteria bacterium]|nr:LuxR C-terminal-related transcriptional regulator [Deltaproteobacteria bacterium]
MIQPVTAGDISREALSILERVGERLEETSNSLRTAAHSSAALESLAAQVSAATRMRLPPRTRQAIALRVAELNSCDYCLAAHTARGEQVGADTATARRYRQGLSDDPKEQVLLALATKVVLERGHHAGSAVEMARRIGVSDAEIIEVIALVGQSTFANYLNSVANTALDHPATEDLGTADSLARSRLDECAAAVRLGLSKRQAQIAAQMTNDGTRREIAERLGLSIHTVNSHIEGIYAKLKIRSRLKLVTLLLKHR